MGQIRKHATFEIEMPLPAVLTIQSGINKLRYATLIGIKRAKTKELKRLAASDLGVAASSTATIERIYSPQKVKQTQLLNGSAREAAAKLIGSVAGTNAESSS